MRPLAGILAAAAALSTLPAAVQAQITLSATGGVNFASMQVHESRTVGWKASGLRGYSVGLALAVPLSDRFLFRVDGSEARRGTRLNSADYGAPVELDVTLSYLEMALLLGARIPGSSASAYLLAGPSAGYLGKCREARRAVDALGLVVENEGSCIWNRDFDFGAVSVAGVEVGLGPLAVSLEGLYYLGLSNVADADDETMKHRGASVRAGIGIPIG